MTRELKDYMVELASNVDRLAAFMKDAPAALRDAGLSEADQALLQSGDQSRIYATLRNLPLPPAASPSPAPQLPTVVAAQYPYGVPGQSAAAAPSAQGAYAMPQWPAAGYGYAQPSYYAPPLYYVVCPYSPYQR